MKELIVECVIVYNDNTTEFTTVDVMLLGNEIMGQSIKDYVKNNHKNVKEVQIIDVLRVVNRKM